MLFNFTASEKTLLKEIYQNSITNVEYTEDEALELLDAVREKEQYYAQGTNLHSRKKYTAFANLGDKIFLMIP